MVIHKTGDYARIEEAPDLKIVTFTQHFIAFSQQRLKRRQLPPFLPCDVPGSGLQHYRNGAYRPEAELKKGQVQ